MKKFLILLSLILSIWTHHSCNEFEGVEMEESIASMDEDSQDGNQDDSDESTDTPDNGPDESPEDPSDTPDENPNENPDDNTDETPQDGPFVVNIDETDLSILPEDLGGAHTPVPLGSTSSNFGHYIYTPSGYTTNGPDYPLIIFLHGWNSNLGNEPLSNVLNSGPPKLINQRKWNPRFPFIVASPQLTTQFWAPDQIHQFIKYLLDNYQINPNRIYLTGLSLGGIGCWFYAGEIQDNYATAIVPISANGADRLITNLKKIPIWAFHGEKDLAVDAFTNYGSVQMVQAINETSPEISARLTVYTDVGHDAWSRTYDGTGQNSPQLYDKFEVDLYDWMLTYKKE